MVKITPKSDDGSMAPDTRSAPLWSRVETQPAKPQGRCKNLEIYKTLHDYEALSFQKQDMCEASTMT